MQKHKKYKFTKEIKKKKNIKKGRKKESEKKTNKKEGTCWKKRSESKWEIKVKYRKKRRLTNKKRRRRREEIRSRDDVVRLGEDEVKSVKMEVRERLGCLHWETD